jgi:hypothetical protein
MTESQWRFLSAIAARVPTDRIVELRLFPVIRQGGMESGAAVVAVEEIVDLLPGDSAAGGASPGTVADASEVAAGDGSPSEAEIAVDLGPLFAPPTADESAAVTMGGPDGDENGAPPNTHRGEVAADEQVNVSSGGSLGIPADQGFSGDHDASAPGDMPPSEETALPPEIVAEDAEMSTRRQVKRYSVLAARYRLTLKGPERGTWDFEITHEADAPLETVERVARGVARRSGDEGQPEHLTAGDIRATLAQPWWSGAQ